MRYRALGPITVEVDGHDAKLGGLRQQMVLAILLRSANRVLSQDALIDSVWAGAPPEAARATVQSYIYNLRRVLGPDAILRRGDGYLIEADSDTFDVLAFEDNAESGAEFLKDDPAAARATLVAGLNLWFGNAYGGVDHPELDAEIRRLGEMRVTAIENRIEADLALGRAGELVAELESLVRDHPLRERFWGQLMLALYRSGRQAEALRTFQNARTHLVDQLGIEPGTELQELEARILDHDPALLLSVKADPSMVGYQGRGSIRGYELRDVIGAGGVGVVYRAYQPSIGREVAIKVIRADSSNDLAFVTRFEREAQRVANLEHPHVLRLHDYWRDPSGAYLVMPLMRGGSLEASLRRGGWSLEPALKLLDQVGSALAYAHRRGVLHGDLKTTNVLIDEDGNAYLSDFGIAAPEPTPLPPLSPAEVASEDATLLSDISALGALTFELLTGLSPIGSAHPPDLGEARHDISEAVAAVVARAMAADPSRRYSRVDEFLRELRRSAGVDVVAASGVVETVSEPIRNPYKGLRAFAEDDAVDFHGRQALVNDLMERIATNRLITVIGPSGSGKSSLVRAGLIPALRAGGLPDSRDWLVTDMFPGSFPFEELEASLSRVAVRTPGRMLNELTQPTGLLRISKRILPGDDSTLLIVIDQFEELFSAVRSESTRRRFLDCLIAVADDERSRVRVVTTIRADFFDRPLAYSEFAEALADGIVTVGAPTRDGLAQAISAPARTVGLDLEPGLVGRIIADVEGQPGALPLLQYALTEMFAQREGSTLTIAGYEATGGVAGALGRRAEELYNGLGQDAKAATREVFLRLVSVDELGTVTRRRARQTEMVSLAVERGGLESMLQAFARFRLLTFDRDPVTRGPTVEVAHEALLTEWPRLRSWIDDARDSLTLARRVRESAQEWIESNEDPSYLLRGVHLEDIETWATESQVVLTSDETRYIAAGIEQRAAEARAVRKRRRRIVTALAGGLVVVSIVAGVAFLQRGQAVGFAAQLLDYVRQRSETDAPTAPDYWAGRVIEGMDPASFEYRPEPPSNPRLDFLQEFCHPVGCFRDAQFVHPTDPIRTSLWNAYAPFHIRHGFVNTAPPGARAPDGVTVEVYVARREGPDLGPDVFPINVWYQYLPDYVVRETTDRCGPGYQTQSGPVECDLYVHDFPDGLPPGRYSIYVRWQAPCSTWVDASFCDYPYEVISLFESQVNTPFFARDFTEGHQWPLELWWDAKPIPDPGPRWHRPDPASRRCLNSPQGLDDANRNYLESHQRLCSIGMVTTRLLDGTGLAVTPIGLGVAALGRPAYINLTRDLDDRSVAALRSRTFEVLNAAYAAGIRYFDTARSYGRGEEFVAQWVRTREVPDAVVGSKWGYRYVGNWQMDVAVHEVKDHSLAALAEQLAQSRRLLGDRLNLYQVHSATLESGVLEDRAVLTRLIELSESGVDVGLSVSGPAQADTVRAALGVSVDGANPFSVVQATWNLLETSAGSALAEAAAAGWGVIVKEALANGRLVVDPPPEVTEVASSSGVGADAVALAVALARPWATVVLSGATTTDQLASNLQAPDVPPELVESLPDLAEDPGEYWRRRSGLSWR